MDNTATINSMTPKERLLARALTGRDGVRGLGVIDMLIFFAFVALFIIGILQFVPELRFGLQNSQAQEQVSEIQRAAIRWRSVRSSYSGLNMSTLCTTNRLNSSICGASNNGASANPWGGNYTITVGSNVGEFSVLMDGLDPQRVDELADNFAPITRDRCQAYDDSGAGTGSTCASLTKATTSITMIF